MNENAMMIVSQVTKVARRHIRVTLLKDENVVRWALGDEKLFPNKITEKAWGLKQLSIIRPDIKEGKRVQWTTEVGEKIVEEALYMLGEKNISKITSPIVVGCKPDLQSDKFIVEVKTGTYTTVGTADQKILAVPFKYSNVPSICGKPLLIVLVGSSEWHAGRLKFGLLPASPFSCIFNNTTDLSMDVSTILKHNRDKNIFYIGLSDFLLAISNDCDISDEACYNHFS